MKRCISALIISLISLFNCSVLKSQAFHTGDVFIGFIYNSSDPGIYRYSQGGVFLNYYSNYLDNNAPYDLSFNRNGFLNILNPTVFTGYEGNVQKLDCQGNYAGSFLTGLSRPIQILFDSSGNVFIGFNFDGLTGGIIKYDSIGNFIQHYTVSILESQVFSMDLSKDQCIINYAAPNSSVVKRYNICTHTLMSDIITQIPGFGVVRIKLRENGEIFVVSYLTEIPGSQFGRIYRYSSSGELLQIYKNYNSNAALYHDISFDPDQTSFWVIDVYER